MQAGEIKQIRRSKTELNTEEIKKESVSNDDVERFEGFSCTTIARS